VRIQVADAVVDFVGLHHVGCLYVEKLHLGLDHDEGCCKVAV
jgi:hypothetical protein